MLDSQNFNDKRDLTNLSRVGALEQNSLKKAFCKNAANGPYINFAIINFAIEGNFGCSVEEGRDYRGILVGVMINLFSDSKVSKFYQILGLVEKDFSRFEVPVVDILSMAVTNGSKNLFY